MDLKSKLRTTEEELEFERIAVVKLKQENDTLVNELYRKDAIYEDGFRENIDIKDMKIVSFEVLIVTFRGKFLIKNRS